MFRVQFTSEAKAEVEAQAKLGGFRNPGVMIHRQGPLSDVKRTAEGQAEWTVERSHPWRAQVGDFSDFGENPTDVFKFDGLRAWLALVPKPEEHGVEVSVRDGALHVEPISA